MTPTGAREDFRFERKFVVYGHSLRELLTWIRTHPAHFRVPYLPRAVNNVYLDTPALAAFATHVNGGSRRFKLRVRWYGEARGQIEKPTLEVKIKRGSVGTKLRYPLPGFAYEGDLDAALLRHALAAQVDEGDVAAALSQSLPVLFNRYQRHYFETADRRFRMTLDTGLRFESVASRELGSLSRHEERELTILELKYAVRDEPLATGISDRVPFRLARFSKYVQGVERLSGLRG